jgi:hypothetical protein
MMSNCCQPVFTWCPILFTLCQDPLNWCPDPARTCCYGAHFLNRIRLVYDAIVINSCNPIV